MKGPKKAKPAPAKRHVIDVVYRPQRHRAFDLSQAWRARARSSPVPIPRALLVRDYATQAEAVEAAVSWAKAVRAGGYLSQVICHGKNGRILWERTYGRDPERSRG